MSYAALFAFPVAAAALALNGHSLAAETAVPPGWSSQAPPTTTEADSRMITVLTYNVRGLPWPLALNRAKRLREIGHELARLRGEGRQPTVVLIQEGFRQEVADLIEASGYAYSTPGPSRAEPSSYPASGDGLRFGGPRYLIRGEGWGKFTSAGLYILSDLPIVDVRRMAYRYCAGWDCLANKGALWARLRLAGGPVEVDVVNTHMNAKSASGVPRLRTLQVHQLQTDELLRFIDDNRSDRPLVIGGDFNVKNAPERYDYKSASRPYAVVSEFCSRPENGCGYETTPGPGKPWLRSQDLQGFIRRGAVKVLPETSATLFASDEGRGTLSDHAGYLVRYRLSWNGDAMAAAEKAIAVDASMAP